MCVIVILRPRIRYLHENICNKLHRKNKTEPLTEFVVSGSCIYYYIEIVYHERNINIIFKLIFTDIYFYFSSFSCIMVIRDD